MKKEKKKRNRGRASRGRPATDLFFFIIPLGGGGKKKEVLFFGFSNPESNLVDPASNICLSQRLSHAGLSAHGRYSETANGSLNQLWFL